MLEKSRRVFNKPFWPSLSRSSFFTFPRTSISSSFSPSFSSTVTESGLAEAAGICGGSASPGEPLQLWCSALLFSWSLLSALLSDGLAFCCWSCSVDRSPCLSSGVGPLSGVEACPLQFTSTAASALRLFSSDFCWGCSSGLRSAAKFQQLFRADCG